MSPQAARRWYEGYCQEVERSIAEANKFNSQQVWTTRKMTDEEYQAVLEAREADKEAALKALEA